MKSSIAHLASACLCSLITAVPASAQQTATHQWPILQNEGHCWIEVKAVAEVVPNPVGNTSHPTHKAACGALKTEYETIIVPDARVCKHVEPCTRRRCELDGIPIKSLDAEASIGGYQHDAVTAHSKRGVSCSVGG